MNNSKVDSSTERLRKASIHFMGKTKTMWKCSSKMPHPNMEARNEFNVHIFGYRFAITWEIW